MNLVTKGRHIGVCDVIQFAETQKGDPQIAVGFWIEAPPEEAGGYYQTYAEDVNRGLTYFGMFLEAQPGKDRGPIDFTMGVLRAIGWTGDDLSELPQLAQEGKLATRVELVVDHEEYNGKTNARIKFVNPLGGGRGAVKLERPMDGTATKAFAETMKSRIRSMGAAKPAAPAAPSKSSALPRRGPPPGVPAHPNAPGQGEFGVGEICGPDDEIPF